MTIDPSLQPERPRHKIVVFSCSTADPYFHCYCVTLLILLCDIPCGVSVIICHLMPKPLCNGIVCAMLLEYHAWVELRRGIDG